MRITITIDDQDSLDSGTWSTSEPLTASVTSDATGEDEPMVINGDDSGVLLGDDHVRLLARILASPEFANARFVGRTMRAVTEAAESLCSLADRERNDNPEYERAIVELGSEIMGMGDLRADDYDRARDAVLGSTTA